MISFLSPLFLAGAAAVAIPIVLHLLKREPEARVRFSAVKLLRNAPVEHTSRRHLRELLLLALRIAALLLLAFAFARPFVVDGAARAASGATVVALDTSLSMTAPGQFARARELARAAVDRAPAGDLIGVVTFGDVARVAASPSSDRGAARSAIDHAQPSFDSTRYRSALGAAVDAMKGRPGRIVVVTDLLENGWDAGERAAVPESVQIEVVDVGAPPPNLAVTAVRINGDRIAATIRNTGPQPREAHVTLNVGTDPNGRRALQNGGESTTIVGPNQSADVVFPRPAGRFALIGVADQTGIEGDNARYLILENTGSTKVLVVGSTADLAHEAFYLQQALIAAGPNGGAYDVEGVAASELASWDQAQMDAHIAVVITSTRALERRGRELLGNFVRSGGGVLVTAGAGVDGEVIADTFGGVKLALATPSASERDMTVRSLAPADVRHPIFQLFGAGASALGLVQFHRVSSIRPGDCATLARFTTGEPAIVDCAPGEGRLLIVASDLDNRWNDFPLHATFVPFLHEAIRYVAGARPRTSEYLVSSAPAGAPRSPGVVSLADSAGGQPRMVAINIDPAESSPGRLKPEEFQTAVTRLKDAAQADQPLEAREQEDRQHIWQYVLALMIAMLFVESFVATRTA